MSPTVSDKTKMNVTRFDEDVRSTGSYSYTTERRSSKYANAAMSKAIKSAYDWTGKRVLDLGCGDGTYTFEFAGYGASRVLGIDPAEAAIAAAEAANPSHLVRFQVGNIYDLDQLLNTQQFDCVVLRGVLHHLPDAARAVLELSNFQGTVIVLEPNGYNPILKLLERVSPYHVSHEERSFTVATIRGWFGDAGFQIKHDRMLNLVPMFCPDWMAKLLRAVTPTVEALPLIRTVACGQLLLVAEKVVEAQA